MRTPLRPAQPARLGSIRPRPKRPKSSPRSSALRRSRGPSTGSRTRSSNATASSPSSCSASPPAASTCAQTAVGALDITLYRDDLRRRPPRALEETRIPAGGIDDAIVVLVDDVLYSGRTIRAALDALRDHGRPAVVQLAVLVDRGHRQLPIRADYVGKNIPTAFGDDVAVRLTEIDGIDSVELARAVPTQGANKNRRNVEGTS
jgi:hypothetical protein